MSNENHPLSIPEIKKLLKGRLKARIENPSMRLSPICIVGPSGVGKSEIVKQVNDEVAKELDMDLFYSSLTMSVAEPPDIMGLAYIKDDVTAYARPQFIPGGDLAGTLLFEEANRVPPDVQNGMLTFIQDHSINGFDVAPRIMPVFVANPMGNDADAESYNTGEMDKATKDRISFVYIKTDPFATIKYLESKYPGHFMVEFLKNNSDFISFNGEGPTPRRLEFAIRSTMGLDLADDAQRKDAFMQLGVDLGFENVARIKGFLKKNYNVIKVGDILNAPKKAKQFITDNVDNPEVIKKVIDALILELRDKLSKFNRDKEIAKEFMYTPAKRRNIGTWIDALPQEHILSILNTLTDQEEYNFTIEYTFKNHFIEVEGENIMPVTTEMVKKLVEEKHPDIKDKI